MFRKTLTAAFAALFLAVSAHAATWTVDQDHSAVAFKVKHLLAKTSGQFNKFEGTIEFEPGKPEAWAASGKIDTASVDTNNEKRDAHLRNADFFDTEKFPSIEFRSTGVREATDTSAKLDGVLTMLGVEKPVVIDVEIAGTVDDPWGSTRAGFTGKTVINRKDFGMVYNQTLDKGGLMLGEEVEITLEIEAIKK
jgi:polyisoprenoid-binding protein YceI